MGEVVPLRREEVEVADEGLAIPPEIVLAIATAAVEAYKMQQREQRNAERRAYYRVNRDRINARKKQRRALR